MLDADQQFKRPQLEFVWGELRGWAGHILIIESLWKTKIYHGITSLAWQMFSQEQYKIKFDFSFFFLLSLCILLWLYFFIFSRHFPLFHIFFQFSFLLLFYSWNYVHSYLSTSKIQTIPRVVFDNEKSQIIFPSIPARSPPLGAILLLFHYFAHSRSSNRCRILFGNCPDKRTDDGSWWVPTIGHGECDRWSTSNRKILMRKIL